MYRLHLPVKAKTGIVSLLQRALPIMPCTARPYGSEAALSAVMFGQLSSCLGVHSRRLARQALIHCGGQSPSRLSPCESACTRLAPNRAGTARLLHAADRGPRTTARHPQGHYHHSRAAPARSRRNRTAIKLLALRRLGQHSAAPEVRRAANNARYFAASLGSAEGDLKTGTSAAFGSRSKTQSSPR